MPDFKVTDEIVSQIVQRYNITKERVETFRQFYDNFAKDMKLQYLAHELGHLFLIELANSTFNSQYDEKTEVEPQATIFGILTIFDKNEFYHNKTTPFKHKSPEDILNDFSLLNNHNNDKLNVS